MTTSLEKAIVMLASSILLLAPLMLLSGCSGGEENGSADIPSAGNSELISEQETFERRASGCAGEQDCATVSVAWEVFDAEQNPKLNEAVMAQLIRQLEGNGTGEISSTQLEEVAGKFLAEATQAREMLQSQGISPVPWQLIGDAKRLSLYGDLLTVEISSYNFTGGAHGLPSTHWLNWDLTTDTGISLVEVIEPGQEKQFWEVARAAHQRWLDERPEADREFRELWPFQHSEDFRLHKEGLALLYDVYVLGPYAFGSVQLTLPWEDLHNIVREPYLAEK